MTELCWPPNCTRVAGHVGYCRADRKAPRCGEWMRNNQEPCARYAGHKSEHRSRFALDNNRDAKWFGVRVAA